MGSVTHIAGADITINGRVIQRCSLCGEKLCDSKGAMGEVGPNGEAPKYRTWEVGRLIRVTFGNPTLSELLPDGHKLPEDSCLSLIED